jgi:ribosomal-protein-alanine N-acetyltransferase
MGLDIARDAVANVGGTLRLSRGTDAGLVATIELSAPDASSDGELAVAPASAEQASEIHDLAQLAGLFVDPAAELARDDAYVLVAETPDGVLAGFLSARLTGDVVELCDLATHPAWRRRGVARRLVLELAARAGKRGLGEIHLEVRQSNLGAITLYDKLGFERIRRRERYYKNPVEDALCFMLTL